MWKKPLTFLDSVTWGQPGSAAKSSWIAAGKKAALTRGAAYPITIPRASRDGRTFSKGQAIRAAGPAYHPQAGIDRDGSLVIAWDVVVDGQCRVSLARGVADADGNRSFVPIATPAMSGSYPAPAVTSRGPLVAWTNRSSSLSVIDVAHLP